MRLLIKIHWFLGVPHWYDGVMLQREEVSD